ncbi:hypothetical protein INT47_006616 [Mucor saturninus]|uniref:Uncharacterized protein n=1 Tax=Mucor saturninus TaxID=64648 RepID=A0A8H7UWP3_9FUNG|nr:hypothetical protein INT47_006616 [Mucor saturninus]
MNDSNNTNQGMEAYSDSVQNTLVINDLADIGSTVSSPTSSVKENGYTPTFDDAACAKTEKPNHEYRMYKGDIDHKKRSCNDPEFGANEPSIATVFEETDGGYGWLVILGTFMVQVTSFGPAACW